MKILPLLGLVVGAGVVTFLNHKHKQTPTSTTDKFSSTYTYLSQNIGLCTHVTNLNSTLVLVDTRIPSHILKVMNTICCIEKALLKQTRPVLHMNYYIESFSYEYHKYFEKLSQCSFPLYHMQESIESDIKQILKLLDDIIFNIHQSILVTNT
jgi:hypothetical protein